MTTNIEVKPGKALAAKPHKTVELMLMRFTDVFIVKSVKNTTYYIPGDRMTRDTVSKCCEMPNWEVTIIDNDFLQSIVGKLPIPIP